MLAVVMSGGGNYGALQVGALQALLDQGFRPEMAIGTSAGSLNAIYLASDPTPEGMLKLAKHWQAVAGIHLNLPNFFTTVRRFVTRQPGLVPQEILRDFLLETLPTDCETFDALRDLHGIQAYAVAVSMERGKTVVFGDRPQDRILDGAMASTALPPFFGPWSVAGERFLDGGVTAKLPILEAAQRGASAILALDIGESMGSLEAATDMASIGGYAISLMVEQQTQRSSQYVRRLGIPLRILTLDPPADLAFWEYGHAQQLVQRGREQTRQVLQREPLNLRVPRLTRLRHWLTRQLQGRRGRHALTPDAPLGEELLP